MSKPQIINFVAFQVLWFICVQGNNLLSLAALLVYMAIHHLWVSNRVIEWLSVFTLAALGVAVESVIDTFKIIDFSGSYPVALTGLEFSIAPLWLMCLWVGFGSTLEHGMAWLKHRPIVRSVLVLFSIPSTYYVGAKFSGSSFPNSITLGLAVEAVVWVLLLALGYKLPEFFNKPQFQNLKLGKAGSASLLVLCFAVLGLSHTTKVEASSFLQGRAYEPETQNLLYTEEYKQVSNNKVQVNYFEASGAPFAEKQLDYNNGKYAPLLSQFSQRQGEEIKFKNNKQDQLELHYKKFADKQEKRRSISKNETLVVDAGFNHFIIDNWNALKNGERKQLSYLVPAKLRTFDLIAYKSKGPCPAEELCLKVAAKNIFIRLFTKSIQVRYDASSKRLLSYRGRSNIANADGYYPEVSIQYSYYDNKMQGDKTQDNQ